MSRVISINLARCTYCRGCEVACEREHHGTSNMFVQLIDERRAVPVNCHHCNDGPCVQVCPTRAMHRDTQDAVTIHSMKCIGCGLCVLACPIGAVSLDWVTHVAHKCDLCMHRLEKNLEPACVTTCTARALTFSKSPTTPHKEQPGVPIGDFSTASNPTILPRWEGALVHRK